MMSNQGCITTGHRAIWQYSTKNIKAEQSSPTYIMTFFYSIVKAWMCSILQLSEEVGIVGNLQVQ